ncbi:unnamed protein product [Phyllotreta striolata]|uniref:Cytochrome P450 monooxygenase n=1 Tax=Phyllotreta striolata TaxID=444603 RepID=A0A9N9TPZ3_PHYSR|nr:unnamed protein product [Phyllotreta striolata]
MLITSSILLDALILLSSAIFALHFYVSSRHKYWKKRGVYSPDDTKPFIGHFFDVLTLKTTSFEWLKKYYDKVNKDFFGLYIFDDHYLILKNPELVKHVLIKDFNNFVDRNIPVGEHELLLNHAMFFQKGNVWKENRSRITPVLSSGKLKSMFPLFLDTANAFMDYLEKKQGILETKEVTSRYTCETISRSAFGVNAHSFEDWDSEFTVNRRRVFGFSLRNAISQGLYLFKPNWTTLFRVHFFDPAVVEFFSGVFIDIFRSRNAKNPDYSDLIDTMRELKAKNAEKIDNLVFSGHAVQFFVAGFESTSSTVAFTLYRFALDPSLQDKGRKEAEEVAEKYGGTFTYEALQDLHYLNMCINETLRMYPVVPFLHRLCVEDYKIPGSDCIIEKDTTVFIPIYGLQMDEKLFPEPHVYNPERFRDKLDQGDGSYYLPFGDGPRKCIGGRLGLMNAKLVLASILRNFEITKCPKTPIPLEFEPRSFLMQSKVGLPLKFSKLQKKMA